MQALVQNETVTPDCNAEASVTVTLDCNAGSPPAVTPVGNVRKRRRKRLNFARGRRHLVSLRRLSPEERKERKKADASERLRFKRARHKLGIETPEQYLEFLHKFNPDTPEYRF